MEKEKLYEEVNKVIKDMETLAVLYLERASEMGYCETKVACVKMVKKLEIAQDLLRI